MSNATAPADVQTAPAQWATVPVTDLTGHSGNLRDLQVPADLLADVTANGVVEPLYVVRTNGDVPQVIDGFQRLAAAVTAGLEAVPVTHRPVIRLDALTPHPKNAREELDITPAFVESLRAEGCRIPVKVRRLDGGAIQVIDGHRRYSGAREAGLTHLPFEWDDDGRDEAGQFLDMITTSQHRKSLTRTEVTAAMFSAAEAGAQVGRIAKAAGVRQKDVKAVVKVRTDETLNAAVAGTEYEWTFDQLAALSEFADAPDAVAAITEAATGDDVESADVEWVITVERTKRDKRRKAEAHRAELEKSGQRIREAAELSERATPLRKLRTPEGKGIGLETHSRCQGQVWVLEGPNDDKFMPYCTSPALYGHAEPGNPLGGSGKTAAEREAEKAARAAVKAGNIDWDAAETRRRQWLADLIKRRTLPKDTANALTGHINTALLDGTWSVGGDLNSGKTTEILADLVGLTGRQAVDRSGFTENLSKDPRRAIQLQFAAIAAVREKSARREAWRTDDQRDPWIRKPTARWFAILEALGYPLSPIEQAVRADEAYEPKRKQIPALTATAADPTGEEVTDELPGDEAAA
ncbi:ParB/RepB/Spo0J family partition protein [Streptomyces jumonjinensis]|uniref:Chromosome partitioning protein ParB n=1 Tax=Streptomyces jumonjinensis TaxID=1945 RepID=A0A646KSU1_STRJU|nr:ParB N-terminal domain-containing protein [Streptomyces jumonjinensis]MQT05107.1 chromosome partitioning protein ParB [Streptomyces jumonjinensis]